MSNRKYNSDGHNVSPDASVITTGTVLRMVSQDGGLGPFSDTVVLGIWSTDKKDNRKTFQTLADAMAYCQETWGRDFDYKVNIEVARPYMYASSIGICFNWLTGVEKFSINPRHIMSNYKVVEMSTGKPANYNQRPDDWYEVIVGNVGTVYKDCSERGAHEVYVDYINQSASGMGRASGETVTMMCNGEIVKEHTGTNTQVDDGE